MNVCESLRSVCLYEEGSEGAVASPSPRFRKVAGFDNSVSFGE